MRVTDNRGSEKPSLGVGRILGETVAILIGNPGAVLVFAIIPMLALTVVRHHLAPGEFTRQSDAIFPIDASSSVSAYIASWIILFVVLAISGGCLVSIVREVKSGQPADIGKSLSSVMPVLIPLIICDSIANIAITLGTVALIVPGLYLSALWCAVSPSIVIEGSRYGSFRRSLQLTEYYRWPCVGVMSVLLVLQVIIEFGLTDPLRHLILSPDVTDKATFLLISGLSGGIGTALYAVASTLIFLRLRDIKEGNLPEVFT